MKSGMCSVSALQEKSDLGVLVLLTFSLSSV